MGDITAVRRGDGTVQLDVKPGPVRVARILLERAARDVLTIEGRLVTFHGVDDTGRPVRHRYWMGEVRGDYVWLDPEPA